jgi:hypothetical protein
MARAQAFLSSFFLYVLCSECPDKRIGIVLSHVINLEFVIDIIMRINGYGSFFSQLIIFFIFINLNAVISVNFFPVI